MDSIKTPTISGYKTNPTRFDATGELGRCIDCGYVIKHKEGNGEFYTCGYSSVFHMMTRPDGYCYRWKHQEPEKKQTRPSRKNIRKRAEQPHGI